VHKEVVPSIKLKSGAGQLSNDGTSLRRSLNDNDVDDEDDDGRVIVDSVTDVIVDVDVGVDDEAAEAGRVKVLIFRK
jgi:hypothetical protein